MRKEKEKEKENIEQELDRENLREDPSSKSGSDLGLTSPRPRSILKPPTVRFEVGNDDDKDAQTPGSTWLPPPPGPDGRPAPGQQPHLHDTMPELPPGQPIGIIPFTAGSEGLTRLDPMAYKVYERFMDELADFVALQGNVVQTRVQVQERRTRLRLYRENVSKHDVDYMNYLRECKAKGTVSEDPKVEELFEAAQNARDLVGPEEMEYEEWDIKLGAEEFALEQKYEALELRFERFFKLRPGASTANTIPSTIMFEPPSIASDPEEQKKREQEPREYSRFQGALIGDKVKIGQLPIVGTGSDSAASLSEMDVPRTNAAVPSGAPHSSNANDTGRQNPSMLSNAPAEQTPADVVDNPQAESGSADLYGSDTAPEFESGEVRMKFSLQGLDPLPIRKTTVHFVDDVDLPPYEETTESFISGVYLPPIDEVPERFLDHLSVNFRDSFGDGDSLLLLGTDSDTQSTLSDYLMSFESTKNRVNRWLLHKLRVSPLEVFELRRKVQESPHTVPDWANLALQCWEGDSAGDSLRTEISPAPYPSTRDLPKRHRWRPRRKDILSKGFASSTNPRQLSLDADGPIMVFDTATEGFVAIPG
jgi:hypothetical protein